MLVSSLNFDMEICYVQNENHLRLESIECQILKPNCGRKLKVLQKDTRIEKGKLIEAQDLARPIGGTHTECIRNPTLYKGVLFCPFIYYHR